MQLVEAGRIDLDQPLSAYLEGFSVRTRIDGPNAPVRVRSLLCHHSGLPTDLTKGMWTDEPFTRVVESLCEEHAAFPPELVFSVVDVELKLREGHLCFSYRMPYLTAAAIQVPLRAVSENEAIILGLGRTRGETLRMVREGSLEDRLLFSGLIGRRADPARDPGEDA